jgi:glycosyltransferase involved in cell wall biosynthesis
MKIAVYTISLNEEKFAQRFMDCIKDEADGIFITDTGSTDKTVEILEANGAIVNKIKMIPWRFDVPRNISMAFVPKEYDILVCIDLDEVLTPGWANAIRESWTPETTRMRYQYTWNTLPDGRPGITFWYDKITSRGYRWVKPVHETLQYYGENEVQTYCEGFSLSHSPDPSKSRSNYLPLLEMGCRDEPNDDRNSHYLGREYMYYGMYEKAIIELQRHLSLPSAKWDAERCASMRFIARSYLYKGDESNAERWALKSCAESPGDREPWLDLARIYYVTKNWSGLYYATKRMLSILERPKSYICETEAWHSYPYDYASIAAYNLGLFNEALTLCEKAIELEPDDNRIRNNLQLILEKYTK